MLDELSDFLDRPWRGRRLPKSSVIWPGELPDEDAPPWVCLSEPGAPVVVRRYDATSRTCDAVSSHGRWLIESALVPRHPMAPNEVQHGWDLAVGDVQPGWCIIYAGHQLWFPQRVLRVDNISDDWQRVWTLGDVSTRDVWDDDQEYEWDNGLATGWSFDEMGWPYWQDEGPWWPLQSETLSVKVRRFVLKKFGLAGECPECGQFGKPIVYGMPSMPLGPHVITGGCAITFDDPEFGCDQDHGWSVTNQGAIHEPGGFMIDIDIDISDILNTFGISPEELTASDDQEQADTKEAEPDELNHDWQDVYPYGEASEHFFQDAIYGMLHEAGGELGDDETYDDDLVIRYLGKDRFDADRGSLAEWNNTEQWPESDK